MAGDSDSYVVDPYGREGCGTRAAIGAAVVVLAALAVPAGCVAILGALDFGLDGLFEDPCPESSSRLISAAARGEVDVVEEELDEGDSPDRTVAGLTALGCAARAGDADMVQLLLDAGGDPDGAAGVETPLEAAVGPMGNPLVIDAHHGHVDVMANLLDAGAHPTAANLRAAAGAPFCGLRVSRSSAPPGPSPSLRVAAVELLLAHGVDPDGGNEGPSPLMCAAWSRNGPLVRTLLEAGANPDHGGEVELSTVQLVVQVDSVHESATSSRARSALPLVGWWDEYTSQGDDLENVPPLLGAVWRGREDVVTALLEAGADPDLAADRALTAMHVAAARNDIEVVWQLLGSGASPEPGLRAGIPAPAEVAERLGHDRVVELLDAAAADS